jgi:hypothetical protein
LMLKARKSDQLIVEGVVLKQHWTDQNKKTEANQRIEWTPTIHNHLKHSQTSKWQSLSPSYWRNSEQD